MTCRRGIGWFVAMALIILHSSAASAVSVTTVLLTVTTQNSPPSIALSWLPVPNFQGNYSVRRKQFNSSSWMLIATIPNNVTSFTDSNVSVGASYIYQVSGFADRVGYCKAGINVPLVESRGKIILIVDNSMAIPLSSELQRLEQDLVGDGWSVIRHDVGRVNNVPTATVPAIRQLIRNDYYADPVNVKAVFLFGHIPVPYSGDIAPDGHPDHSGAWPTDVYYADMDGTWTDYQTLQTANSPRQNNVPGDGKFDQFTIPSTIELSVGRVDLADMPAFPGTETELLRQYLNKDHAFRNNISPYPVQERALMKDSFGYAYTSSAFASFSAMFGPSNIVETNWFGAQDFLWGYGGGGGSFTTCFGVGSSVGDTTSGLDFAVNTSKVVFTMLFGSYFGDWDTSNNFLRAPLANAGYGLSSAWSGAPEWYFQNMALGDPIGDSLTFTINVVLPYWNREIQTSLMGDPSLRLHNVSPVSNVSATASATQVNVTWTASPDSIAGYYVYRSISANGPFTRLTPVPITTTFFVDTSQPTDSTTYMVRAVKLQTSNSGSYWNASTGMMVTVQTISVPNPTVTITLNPPGPRIGAIPVTINADASGPVSITNVEFFDNTTKIGEDTSAPFQMVWLMSTVNEGAHTIIAKASDVLGRNGSASASVIVDHTSSIIYNITVVPTLDSVNVSWDTNEATVGDINYGLTTAFNQNVHDAVLSVHHGLTLTSLLPDRGYHAVIVASDQAGNLSTSADFIFRAPAVPDTTPRTLMITSPVDGATVKGLVTIQATVTDHLGIGRIDFYDQINNQLIGTDATPPYSVQWDTDLVYPGSKTIEVKEYDAFGFLGLSKTISVTTERPPVVQGVQITPSATTASIFFFTDPQASAIIEYGPTTSYGFQKGDPGFLLSRTMFLDNLAPNTLYHFRLTVADPAGNTRTTSDNTFQTVEATRFLQFVEPAVTTTENSGSAILLVRRLGLPKGDVTVNWATAGGTAQVGSDYSAPISGILSWADGDMSDRQITIHPLMDANIEPAETVLIRLSNATEDVGISGTNPATLTIIDSTRLIQFAQATFQTCENADVTVVTLKRKGNPQGVINAACTLVANGTAVENIDYRNLGAISVQGADGDMTDKQVTITVINDTKAEPDETFGVRLTPLTPLVQMLGPSLVTMTIHDDDAPFVQLTQSNFETTENGQTVYVSVKRMGDPSVPLSVDWFMLTDVSARSGSDYYSYGGNTGRLTWSSGDTSNKTIGFMIMNDNLLEPDETFKLQLQNPQGGAAIQGSIFETVTIHDGTRLVGFVPSTVYVNEGAPSASVTLHRIGNPVGGVSAMIYTVNGSALENSDFRRPSGTGVSWGDGDMNDKTVSIPILNDAVVETTEFFEVKLYTSSYGSAYPGTCTVYILDNDFSTAAASAAPTTTSSSVSSITSGRNISKEGNPFLIPYFLASAGFVTLTITDRDGKEVYQFEENNSAGDHTIEIQAGPQNGFSSGVYYLKASGAQIGDAFKKLLVIQ